MAIKRIHKSFPLILGLTALPISAIIFITIVRGYWAFTVDDAYITFRYAQNWAEGFGPVFNHGEPPAEGYTTFLWMSIMVLPYLFKTDAVEFAKWVGVVSTLATMVIIFLFVLQLTNHLNSGWKYISAGVVVLLIAVVGPSALHSVSGMETSLFTFLLSLFFYLLVQSIQNIETRFGASPLAVIALLLGLTRPEGNLVAFVGFAITLMLITKDERKQFAQRIALFYLAPAVLYFLWRTIYYATLLPLPFYVKVVSQESFAGLSDVLDYLKYFGLRVGLLFLISLPALRREIIPTLLAAVSFLLFFLFPKHIMGYSWRYLFPVTPLLLTLVGVGLAYALSVANRFGSVMSLIGVIVICGFTIYSGYSFYQDVYQETENAKWYSYSLEKAHIELGHRLAGYKEDGRKLTLAISDAGAVPYYSGWRTVDMMGLNDKHIALTGHDPYYVLDQYPDVVVVMSYDEKKFVPVVEWENALYAYSTERGMEVTRVLNHHFYYLWIMVMHDDQLADYLRSW